MNPEDDAEEDGANIDLDSQRKGKCVVLKTSTRQVRLPNPFSRYDFYIFCSVSRFMSDQILLFLGVECRPSFYQLLGLLILIV